MSTTRSREHATTRTARGQVVNIVAAAVPGAP
jgi:hypothetical protein